jgi:hypothetical protein
MGHPQRVSVVTPIVEIHAPEAPSVHQRGNNVNDKIVIYFTLVSKHGVRH